MLMAISQRQSAWAETPRTIHRTMRWLLALLPMGLDSYVDAPYGKGFLSGGLIGCFHMSGLFVRYEV
ncbi:hypothetical protein SFHH103_psfHH103d_249 (plasmid) [Sinorhizobium fredii HH103]|nr:hypothetical protein SFHH103_04393 [Sinorhizobium fredii HH103]CEO91447.1 hypothetical protein SFHH103_psfHH103d_249 [Sinorhizobium fredii HH103]